MRKLLLLSSLFFILQSICFAQTFPQDQINTILQSGFERHSLFNPNQVPAVNTNSSHLTPVLAQMDELKRGHNPTHIHNSYPQPQNNDTLIVGLVPNDTLRITGNWTHTGPIYVFNTGVLIFHNATVIDTGDVYVFGNGKWIADSSSFFFPQKYFYERSFLVVENGTAHFGNCSLNYSGMSHGLTVAGHGTLDWENVHQNDWTTCGLSGHANLNIHKCNLSGEYILSDTATANFIHADTIILWHQLPSGALINYSFPNPNPVYNYVFDNATPGVAGLNYHVHVDSCSNVSWALMPVNGSDVTISNSTIRLIGAWFMNGDIATAHGIFNNSNYANTVIPLADRNLHLINTTVQTWSMYVFDSSQVTMDSCQFGEVGTQQRANVFAGNVLLDGTGGYFWATDSSFTSATNSICYSTCRSEKKAFFVLGYSWLPFSPPTAIHNSNLICVQNNLVSDPVPYDGSVAWLANIESPDTSGVNALVAINGSAWINQGPLGNPIDFGSYSLYWQNPVVSNTWYPIVVDSLIEISHGLLGNWNTTGFTTGTYLLKIVLKSNFNDSVEGLKVVTLLQNPFSVNEISIMNAISFYPNPFSTETILKSNKILDNASLIIFNAFGQVVKRMDGITGKEIIIQRGDLSAGIYFVQLISTRNEAESGKLIIIN